PGRGAADPTACLQRRPLAGRRAVDLPWTPALIGRCAGSEHMRSGGVATPGRIRRHPLVGSTVAIQYRAPRQPPSRLQSRKLVACGEVGLVVAAVERNESAGTHDIATDLDH